MIFSNSIGEILDDKGIIDEDFINFINILVLTMKNLH